MAVVQDGDGLRFLQATVSVGIAEAILGCSGIVKVFQFPPALFRGMYDHP